MPILPLNDVAEEKAWKQFLFGKLEGKKKGLDKREPRGFKSSNCFANRFTGKGKAGTPEAMSL